MTNYGKIMQISKQGQADTCHCQYMQYGQLKHMQEEQRCFTSFPEGCSFGYCWPQNSRLD